MEKVSFDSIYEGEYMISELIKGNGGCYTHFNYEKQITTRRLPTPQFLLSVVTYNPIHKTHFLLHELTAEDKISCLQNMYDHIYGIKNLIENKECKSSTGEICYTIMWMEAGKRGTNTSFFYGKNLEEIIKKFYYGKCANSYSIINLHLNAES